jgi:septum site-determining protein MinD
MSKIISIHSFRRGTGKSNIAANLTTLFALEGRRVAVIDTDIQSPSLYLDFGLTDAQITFTLNDYLWGKCDLRQAVYDVTANLDVDPARKIKGRAYLVPASPDAKEIAQVLRGGYDPNLPQAGFQKLMQDLALNVLLVDTHAGISEATLAVVALSDVLSIILRPDLQDYQGTSLTVELARRLEVPRVLLIVNEVSSLFKAAQVKSQIEAACGCEVAAMLPHSNEMLALAGTRLFVLNYPTHPLTLALKQLAVQLVA